MKALFRRVQIYKLNEQWSDALRDLDLLLQVEESETTKKDIAECFTKYAESKKAQAAKKAEERKCE